MNTCKPLRCLARRRAHWYREWTSRSRSRFEKVTCATCGKRGREEIDVPGAMLCARCWHRRRKAEERKREPERAAYRAQMKKRGKWLLAQCERILVGAGAFDTSVRDTIAEGLAHVVYAAQDCLAIGQNLNGNRFTAFIAKNTRQWFRDRGFVEWFAMGAATGMNLMHFGGGRLSRAWSRGFRFKGRHRVKSRHA